MDRSLDLPLWFSGLFDQMVQQVTEHTVDHHLRLGDKLPAELLMAWDFGMSRLVVREVSMRSLTGLG